MADDFETVSLLVDAGQAKPGGSINPTLGPLGVNIGAVLSQINEETKGYRSLSQIIKATKLPSILMYGPIKSNISQRLKKIDIWPENRPPPGEIVFELLEKGLIELHFQTQARGRGGIILTIRIAHQKPQIKAHIKDRLEGV